MSRLTNQKKLDAVIHVRIEKQKKDQLVETIQRKGLRSVSTLCLGLIDWWLENNLEKIQEKK